MQFAWPTELVDFLLVPFESHQLRARENHQRCRPTQTHLAASAESLWSIESNRLAPIYTAEPSGLRSVSVSQDSSSWFAAVASDEFARIPTEQPAPPVAGRPRGSHSIEPFRRLRRSRFHASRSAERTFDRPGGRTRAGCLQVSFDSGWSSNV